MGYVYAMSNKSMPGILKIGMTERSIEERLKEANGTFTLIPFVVEMSKYVSNCKEKERCIHQILQSKRVNPKKEFFQVTLEEIKPIFDLMDSVENIESNKSMKIIEPIKYQEYAVEYYFDMLSDIHMVLYGNHEILIDHKKKEFVYNNISSKSLQFIINMIDTSIEHSDIIKEIIKDYLIQTDNKILKISELRDMFKNVFSSNMGNGIEPPYKDFFDILSKKYPTRNQGDGFIGLEITYDPIINKETVLNSCYILINGQKIILNEFINKAKIKSIISR
jgi:hypothetical protein